MPASRWVLLPLRILLVVVFCGLIVAEFFSMPGQFRHLAAEAPRLGAVPWVLLTVAILEIVALQVVVVCIWRLLGMIQTDRIFSTASFAWVDVLVATMAAAWLAFTGVAVFLIAFIYVTPELRDPGTPALLIGLDLIGGVVVLVVLVMRALLRQAATLRSDLEAVI